MNSSRRRLRFFHLSFGFMAARFLLGIVRTRTLTELLPKELYGALTLTVTITTFAAVLGSLGAFEFLVRTLPGCPMREQRAWLGLLLRRLALPVWLAGGAVLVVARLGGALDALRTVDLILAWIAFGLTSWLLYRTFYFLGSGRLLPVRLIQISQHDLWFLAILISLLFTPATLSSLLVVWCGWLLLVSIAVNGAWGGPRASDGHPPGRLRDAVIFGLPLLPMIAGDVLFRTVDRTMLLGFAGLARVAEYTLCMNIATIAYMVGASLLDLHVPVLNEQRNRAGASALPTAEMKRVFSRMLRHALGIALPAGAALLLMPDDILGVLSGRQFRNAAPLLAWTGPAPLFFLLSAVFGRAMLSLDRSRRVGGYTLAAAALNMALNLLLIPAMGAPGAAVATAASLAALSLGMAHNLRVSQWIDRPALRPVRLALAVVGAPCLIALFRAGLPGASPWIRLAVTGAGLLAMLWIAGVLTLSDFRMISAVDEDSSELPN